MRPIRVLKLEKLKKLHKSRTFRYELLTRTLEMLSNKAWTNNYAACFKNSFTKNGFYVRSVSFNLKEKIPGLHYWPLNSDNIVAINLHGELLCTVLDACENSLLALAKEYFPGLFIGDYDRLLTKWDWLVGKEYEEK